MDEQHPHRTANDLELVKSIATLPHNPYLDRPDGDGLLLSWCASPQAHHESALCEYWTNWKVARPV